MSTAAAFDEVPTTDAPPRAFLDVRNLRVHFPTEDGLVKAVDGLSFTLERGKTLGIVGESGSGKSVTSLAIMGLHKNTRARLAGDIWLDGKELVSMSADSVRRLRGERMAMIFQDPLSAMHPFYTIGQQIVEAYRVHRDVSKAVARRRAVEMLDLVGIPTPDKRVDDYPHQFSGGMRQRAMIAMALVCDPSLLIADEPTTALDVTVQAQILDLMRDLQREFNSAIILITHDLGVVAELADEIVVMYGGRAVEQGRTDDVFYRHEMPYTWGLLGSMPRLDRARQERLAPVPGAPPSLISVPSGCVFHPRCQYREHVPDGTKPTGACVTQPPELFPSAAGEGHRARCHIAPDERRRVWADELAPRLQP